MAGALSAVGALAGVGSSNPYGTASTGEWNLARGVFTRKDGKQVIFFYETAKEENRHQRTSLESVTDSGGRRLAKYEYPYRDGQKIQDLGRKGETYQFNIKFVGLDYQTKFDEFMTVVYKTSLPGIITHPVRGALTVRFDTFEFQHRFDEWNAVTIRANFVEDTSDTLTDSVVTPLKSIDASLRNGIQILSDVQSFFTAAIGDANLINVARTTLKARLASVLDQVGNLMGNLVATFSSDAKLKQLVAQAAGTGVGLDALNSGVTTSGTGVQSTLPPLVQTGFDATTITAIEAQSAAFVQAGQITSQQAVFQANQARQGISAAIAEVENMLGIDAFDMVFAYRQLAVQIQQTVEDSISAAQAVVTLYTTTRTMSLRLIAFENDLSPDRQNDIEALNPGLPSVNYIPAGTSLVLPVA